MIADFPVKTHLFLAACTYSRKERRLSSFRASNKPLFHQLKAEESTTDLQERLMNIGSPFIPDFQAYCRDRSGTLRGETLTQRWRPSFCFNSTRSSPY
jgi:hypothetical protein